MIAQICKVQLIFFGCTLMSSDFKKRLNNSLDLFRGILIKDTWQNLDSCDVLLVRHDNNCGYTIHKTAYAQVIDSFGDLCTKRGLTVKSVATPYSRLVGKKAYHSPVSYSQSLFIISILGKGIKLLRGPDKSRGWIESHRTELWYQILEKAKPRCVIGILPDKYLCRAGKKMGIPVYDLQHGAIGDADPYYGTINRMTTPPENFPDGFLCWDNQSSSIIAEWAQKQGIRTIIVGNPWFLRFVNVQPEDILVKESAEEVKIIKSNQPCIVVSLQWGLEDRYPDKMTNGVLIDALERVILDTINIYNWIIRLHPVQLRSHEKDITLNYLRHTFGDEKTQLWLDASEIPLPVLLSKADLHLTYESAVVIESAWMGLRSGLLSDQFEKGKQYQDLYSHERSIGMAEVIPQNVNEIKKWITDTLVKGRGQSTLKDSGQNLNAFIDEIAKGLS